MKTGKHYFGLLTEEEQRNFKQACEKLGNISFETLMRFDWKSFSDFIGSSFRFKYAPKGADYWYNIQHSNRDENRK